MFNGWGTTEKFNQEVDWKDATSIHQFHATDIHGEDVPFSKYKEDVMIVVNVASRCSLAKMNYSGLQNLYEKYGSSKGLVILAFPCNQFNDDKPETSKEILEFVEYFHVDFDLFQKVDVNGDTAHPVWKWLKKLPIDFAHVKTGHDIKWNFTKFVLYKNGHLIYCFDPTSDPISLEELIESYS